MIWRRKGEETVSNQLRTCSHMQQARIENLCVFTGAAGTGCEKAQQGIGWVTGLLVRAGPASAALPPQDTTLRPCASWSSTTWHTAQVMKTPETSITTCRQQLQGSFFFWS